MKRALVICALVAGCNAPEFSLRFRVTSGSAAACFNGTEQATKCDDVSMLCPSVVSIRVFNPNDSTAPYISVCKPLEGQPNLCTIATIDLPPPTKPVAEQTLEVEMLVYPKSAIPKDPDTGALQCPTGVLFDATGFPIAPIEPCTDEDPANCPPTPAVGGVAYYHPGDPETVVELGCTDLGQLNTATCSGLPTATAIASVQDFDTRVSVSPSLGDHLSVAIDNPIGFPDHYEFQFEHATRLSRTKQQPAPEWGGSIPSLAGIVCLEVLEDGAQTTGALTCDDRGPKGGNITATGNRLAKSTLLDISAALGLAQFPDTGLVIGIVLDHLGAPVANVSVAPTGGTIKYLSADRHSLVPNMTSTSGVFASLDAPFGTEFSALSGLDEAKGHGGLVSGKVTIVIMQFKTPLGI